MDALEGTSRPKDTSDANFEMWKKENPGHAGFGEASKGKGKGKGKVSGGGGSGGGGSGGGGSGGSRRRARRRDVEDAVLEA